MPSFVAPVCQCGYHKTQINGKRRGCLRACVHACVLESDYRGHLYSSDDSAPRIEIARQGCREGTTERPMRFVGRARPRDLDSLDNAAESDLVALAIYRMAKATCAPRTENIPSYTVYWLICDLDTDTIRSQFVRCKLRFFFFVFSIFFAFRCQHS